jgi:hypothetical protein
LYDYSEDERHFSSTLELELRNMYSLTMIYERKQKGKASGNQ